MIHERMQSRAGFTLLELLVALVLLDLGLIALVGACAALSRTQSLVRADARGLQVASSRVERMLSQPCQGAVTATAHPTPVLSEWWTDTPGPNGTRQVSDSVAITTERALRFFVLKAAGRC